MELNPILVWQIITTVALAPLAYFLRASLERLREIEQCLARTREQLAKEYATKADVHADIGRVLDGLARLDQKLDRILMKQQH